MRPETGWKRAFASLYRSLALHISILYFNLQILFSHLLNDGPVLFSDCTRYHALSELSQSVPLRCPSPVNQPCYALFHQKIQVPNQEEFCTLCSAVLGWNSDSHIHRPYPSILGIHRWGFLHFRHLNMLVIVQVVRPRPHAKRLIQDTSASSWDASVRRMTVPGMTWSVKISAWRIERLW